MQFVMLNNGIFYSDSAESSLVMSNQPNKPNGLMIESKSVSKVDNYLRTKHDHSESSTSGLSFLMSCLKRDCREVFV